MLTLRAGHRRLLADIFRAVAGFARLASNIAPRPVVARTWLQHALPMPFGLKLAEMPQPCTVRASACGGSPSESLALQFGGAAGTLAALGDKGWLVAESLADELKLPVRMRRGIPIATASPRRLQYWRSLQGLAARSHATSS